MGCQSSKSKSSGAGKDTAKKMENPTDILKKGIVLLTKAVDEDTKHNYEEALRCYVKGVMVLLHVAKHRAETQNVKYLIKEKCVKYIARIRILKDYLNQISGEEDVLDALETLSDKNLLNVVTDLIYMCGYKSESQSEPESGSESESDVKELIQL